MRPPRIAIVIPVRNGERFLAETLECALAQSERDLEVVVVDDGSTDRTPALAAAVAARDRRVRLLRRAHAGIAAARNAGTRACRAPLLCYMDGDDLFASADHLGRQAEFLDRHPGVGLVYSPVVLFLSPDRGARERYAMVEDGTALGEELLRGGTAFPPHAALLRRRWYDLAGGFDGRFALNEDTLFWLCLLRVGCRFAFLPGPPVLYRRHAGAWSGDLTRAVPDRLRLLEWLSRQPMVRGTARGEAVRSRQRFLTFVLSEAHAARGKLPAARAAVLRSLRWCRRPGHLLEVVCRLVAPGPGRSD